ncbi:translation elongation factor Ts [candidate division KSB3 bacterium]|uniref:Elongation factor Ts n=1 Tax=candidate division KSB3 bacterium TaxID=2044937 RepID=A0A9D5JY72_9BACT|nr:translation elongation factor Ts [candidate division KSB3 bacterium]MBD3326423.1 translation elongation factor Ts [candidate division KSB3 bacterium]
MMAITAQMVKELREKTGAGIMDCKKALTETEGDLEKAIEALRKKGLAAAAKKSGRVTSEGAVASYIHAGGKIGVLVEINCETDFVARTDQFQTLVKDIAMHIAASNPLYLKREDVPAEVLQKEREIYRAQFLNSGKPEKVIEKIVDGKIDKYYTEMCLYEQPFVKDTDKTVQQLITETIAQVGENINIRRFARFVLGEGIEKEEKDLAQEVAAQRQAVSQ